MQVPAQAVSMPKPTKAMKAEAKTTAIDLCRQREILPKMADVALTLLAMLAWRQHNEAPEVFNTSEANVRLADAAIGALDRVAKYGYPLLAKVEFMGDAPQVHVQNRVEVRLNIDDPRQRRAGDTIEHE